MKLTSWLPYVTSRILAPLASAGKPRRARRNGSTRLAGYLLETRTLLTVFWEGGADGFGDGTSWNDRFSWIGDSVPGLSDEVTIDVPGDATIHFSSGSTQIASLTSTETLVISGGSLDIAQSSSTQQLLLSGGTLTGVGNVSVSGQLHWYSGTMSGAGTTTVLAGGSLLLDTHETFLNGRTLLNQGTGEWLRNSIHLNNGAVFTNAGTLNVQSPYDMRSDVGGGTFNNTGTITRTVSLGQTTIYGGCGV